MNLAHMLDMEARVKKLLGRATRYKSLAAAFTYPDCSVLAELREGRWPDPEQDSQALRRAFAAFRTACVQVEASSLQEEYLLLFDRQVRCSPYESSYGDGRRLGGKPVELADITGFYIAFGLEPSCSHREMPDHIAVELTFMSVLCLKEAYALFHGLAEPREVSCEAQRTFLGDHLGRWAWTFVEGVEAAPATPFYRAAAALLREFVAEDCRQLGVTPSAAARTAAGEAQDDLCCPFASAPERPVE